jgi:hypothetical protein
MIESDIDPQVEEHLRAVLRDVADRYDPQRAVASEAPRTGRLMRVAAVALVVVGIGGVGVLAAQQATEPTGANDTPPSPTQPDIAPDNPAHHLLYPTATLSAAPPGLTIVELTEGPKAMVQAPDGTLYRISAGTQGGFVPDAGADTVDIGGHTVVAIGDERSSGYSWADDCVVVSVVTEADGQPWGPEPMALLESFSLTGTTVGVELPESWLVIDHGSNAPLVQLSYAVEVNGAAHAVVLAQSLGASIAALGSPMGPMESVTLDDGTPAWFEPDSDPSPRLSFSRDGVAVWIWGDGLTADDMIAAATLLAPAPEVWDDLLTSGPEVAPTGTAPAGDQPDLCGVPTLSITPP